MVQRTYLTVADLPPRPGPSTGLRRPPYAPGFIGHGLPAEGSIVRENDSAAKPSPPPGQGPVLV